MSCFEICLPINTNFIPLDLSLDAMDSSGDQHIQIQHNIFKHRLDLDGKPIEEGQRPIKEIVLATSTDPKNTTCGSCYGAEQNSTQ